MVSLEKTSKEMFEKPTKDGPTLIPEWTTPERKNNILSIS